MNEHGRLIDAEWLKVAIHNFFTGKIIPVTEDDIMAYIDAAPTIETKCEEREKGECPWYSGYSD